MKKQKYQLSPNVRIIFNSGTETAMVYHALYGNPRIINNEGLHFLNLFRQPVGMKEISEICDGDSEDTIQEFTEIFFLVKPGFDEKKFLREKKNSNLSKCKNGGRLTGWVSQSVIRATLDAHTVFISNPQPTLVRYC